MDSCHCPLGLLLDFLTDCTIGRAFGTLCRLSVVAVTFCIVAKQYVLAKKLVEIDFLAANRVRLVGLCGQN